MRKKLTAVLPAAAMFAYALAGTTGIAQNVQRICNEAG